MALFGPPDVAKLQKDRNIKKLIHLLQFPYFGPNVDLRDPATEALIAIGQGAIDPLLRALQADTWQSGLADLTKTSGTPDRNAQEFLREFCSYRAALVKALWFINFKSAEPALATALADSDLEKAVIMILGKEPAALAAPLMMRALTSEHASLRATARRILMDMSTPAASFVVPALTDARPEVRSLGAEILYHIGDQSSADALVSTLSDPVPAIKQKAALGLAKLLDKRAIKPLADLVTEGGITAGEALLALSHLGDVRTFPLPPETIELLEREELKALQSGGEGRLERSWSVKRISDKDGVPELAAGDVICITNIPGWWQKVISADPESVNLQDLKIKKMACRSIQDCKTAWRHLNPPLVESAGEELYSAWRKALDELTGRYQALDFAPMDPAHMASWLRQEIKWFEENDPPDFELEEESQIRKNAIRRLGEELNGRGGMNLMLEVFRRARGSRLIEMLWDMIGDWRG